MDADQELASFIGAAFRSVWALELLCDLRRRAGAPRSPEDLVESLRASDLVVRTSLAELMPLLRASHESMQAMVSLHDDRELDDPTGREG